MHDGALIQIVDAAMAEAVRNAGSWLACRPGCAECCIGEFEISTSDARRLRDGLAAVAPAVAARIRGRAKSYPPDAESAPCPALDPDTLTCDLYAWRPITCRTFGPPVRCENGALAICELCFDGAAPEVIDACAVDLPPEAFADDPIALNVAQALCSTY
jgi:Fe-S-cluster containining protein